MLVLLPPSETKRDGGVEGSSLDLGALSFPELTPERRRTLRAMRALARNLGAATAALRLGSTQAHEVARNRAVLSSPVLPAIDRYDGVLYDALDAASLPATARAAAGRNLAIASAAFGLLGGLDPIPAYRLSHYSRLPGLALGRLWREPLARVLAAQTGLLLDLRSESYAKLGALPERPDAAHIRVATGTGERRRALGHFNKQAKGEFVRRLLLSGAELPDAESLLDWARGEGVSLERSATGLDLLV